MHYIQHLLRRLFKFFFNQLAHTLVTMVVLIILFLGAERVGALSSILPSPRSVNQTGITSDSYIINYMGNLYNNEGQPIHNETPGLDMRFSLYDSDTATTPIFSETHVNVPVINGLFSVNLGSINPLMPADINSSGNLWLGIQVGSDPEMVPRQLLGDSFRAMEAGKAYSLDPAGDIDMKGYGLNSVGGIRYAGPPLGGQALVASTGGRIQVSPDRGLAYGSTVQHSISANNHFELQFLVRANEMSIYQTSDEGKVASQATFPAGEQASIYLGGYLNQRELPPPATPEYEPGGLRIYANGNGILSGTLTLKSIVTGAVIESNLQTQSELTSRDVDHFNEGDILCWGQDKLELCRKPNDPLVQAVADEDGKPIVIGAEAVKVIGPVNKGDLLVTSPSLGYAMVNNVPASGTVIAQALEDFKGNRGVIRAMIRKF